MSDSDVHRRGFLSLAALAAAASVAPSLSAQSRLETTGVTIAVGGKASFYFLPLTIAQQLGYFKGEGLDVEISDFAGGSLALQAVQSGVADVVSGAYEHTIALQAKGQRFQAFVLQGRAPQISLGVSSRTMPQYQGLADLKGKRIGVSAPGSSTNMVAKRILSRAGLAAGDVTFLGVGSAGGALAAVRSGLIDALSNAEPVMTMLEQKGELRIVADTRTLKGTLEVFGGPMPAACLYAPREFVLKYPNTVQALTNAIVRSLKWLQTAGPRDIIKTVPEAYLLGDRALYLAAFYKVREAISPDGMFPEDGAKTALKALASFDVSIQADRIDLALTFTNAFARRAKQQFKA
ncbi:MAG: ABC transporter substrate-binding protein [Rhodoferax sp.]|nr:ABC transporter substrate-binding protein [Rhodoferax sp.]MBK9236955.1 ABC transporter substrate-binding protein [Rhodoferax sp.]